MLLCEVSVGRLYYFIIPTGNLDPFALNNDYILETSERLAPPVKFLSLACSQSKCLRQNRNHYPLSQSLIPSNYQTYLKY